jgi:hypothetical protein
MKKAVWSGIMTAVGMLAMSTSVYAQAQTASGTVNVNASVNAKAKLTINGGATASISFADADPDVVATLPAAPLTIAVKARTSANGAVTLTVRASQDLTAAPLVTIDISGLKWTSTGANFAGSGTSSTAAEVNVMSVNGSGNHTGIQSYTLDNSWAYATGTYTTTLTYTLTAP